MLPPLIAELGVVFLLFSQELESSLSKMIALRQVSFSEQQVQPRVDQIRRDRYQLLHSFYPGAEDEESWSRSGCLEMPGRRLSCHAE